MALFIFYSDKKNYLKITKITFYQNNKISNSPQKKVSSVVEDIDNINQCYLKSMNMVCF